MSLPFSYRVHRILFRIRERLYPAVCAVCGEALEAPGALCPTCLGEYRRARLFDCGQCGKPLDSCACSTDTLRKARVRRMVKLFRYRAGHEQSTESKIIFALKHKNLETLFHFMGEELAEALSRVISEPKESLLVTYVPRTQGQITANGYDHARLLALALADAAGLSFCRCLARRSRRDKEQKKMDSYGLRVKNVADAFCLARGCSCRGKRVLLVDDVVTTGATASDCARVLRREGGAKEVIAVSLSVVPHNVNPLLENQDKLKKK